jgi:hypothetical protein
MTIKTFLGKNYTKCIIDKKILRFLTSLEKNKKKSQNSNIDMPCFPLLIKIINQINPSKIKKNDMIHN